VSKKLTSKVKIRDIIDLNWIYTDNAFSSIFWPKTSVLGFAF